MRNKSGEFLFFAEIADKNAAVLLKPIAFESDKAHLHITFLNEPPNQTDLVEFLNDFSRDLQIIGWHIEKFGDTLNEEGNFFEFTFAARIFAVK